MHLVLQSIEARISHMQGKCATAELFSWPSSWPFSREQGVEDLNKIYWLRLCESLLTMASRARKSNTTPIISMSTFPLQAEWEAFKSGPHS